jgi:hypothetical protein
MARGVAQAAAAFIRERQGVIAMCWFKSKERSLQSRGLRF